MPSSITYGKVDGGSFSFPVGQSFNADGQLQSHTYPDGSTQSYNYDAGRLAKVTLPNQSEISYGNYSWMVPTQISTPGASKTLSYDALQRPSGIEVKTSPTTHQTAANQTAQILMSRLYQYDAAGNITQIKSDLGQTDYGYDKLSRLIQATPDNALQTLGLPSEQYGYDQVHNRTSSGHQSGTWAYNSDNQLTQYPYLKPFTPGMRPIDTQVSYTPQGHTQKETSSQWEKSYQYNAAERLTKYQSTNPGQSSAQIEANYRYDPFGRRISKSVKEGATTKTIYFLYSDQGLMGEADETGKLTKAYGFNPMAAQQGLWSTDPIWQANVSSGSLTAQDTHYHYLHTDHLGTPQLATTKEGQISWKAQSEAFGAAGILQGQSTIEMNLRFPGQYFDSETNSHYNFHRDYKPNAGRYIQSDPVGLTSGVNAYIYALANAITNDDAEGLCTLKDAHWDRRPAPWQSKLSFVGVTDIHPPKVSKMLTIYMFEAIFNASTRIVAYVTCIEQCCQGESRRLITIDKRLSHDFSVPIGYNPVSAWFGPKAMIAMMVAEALTSAGYLKYTAEVARTIKEINDLGPWGLCLGSGL